MDILDISKNPHQLPPFIYQKYGSPISLWDSIRMGGTGSPGLRLNSAGPKISSHLGLDFRESSEPIRAHIQLLQEGILVRFTVRLAVHLAIFHGTEIKKVHLRSLHKSSLPHQFQKFLQTHLPSFWLFDRSHLGLLELHFSIDLLTLTFETQAFRATHKFFARSFLADRFTVTKDNA